MKINRIKLIAFALFTAGSVGVAAIGSAPRVAKADGDFDAAAVYKAKCAMCHSPKAEKLYDPAAPEDEQIAAILKGKKAAKPPNMPGFEEKGMTADQAKSLVQYMKSLRTPAAE